MHIYNMFVDTYCIDYGEISATWVINGITLRVINKDECQSQDKNNHRLTNAKVCQQNTADNPLTTFFFSKSELGSVIWGLPDSLDMFKYSMWLIVI